MGDTASNFVGKYLKQEKRVISKWTPIPFACGVRLQGSENGMLSFVMYGYTATSSVV
jgi:hypothetical protein